LFSHQIYCHLHSDGSRKKTYAIKGQGLNINLVI
jgi:hypothetical protein